GLRGGVQLVAGFGADRLGPRAGAGEIAFIGLLCGFRTVPQLLRLGEIALDLVLPRIDHLTDARQRDAREDEVERDKGDGERHQLRRESRRIEWRENLVPAIGFGAGAMTFSHGILLLLSAAPPPLGCGARPIAQIAYSSSSAISSEKM